MHDPDVAAAFDPSALVESGLTGRVKELGDAIAAEILRLNAAYAAGHGRTFLRLRIRRFPGTKPTWGNPSGSHDIQGTDQ